MKILKKKYFFSKIIFCHFFRGLHSKHRFSRGSSPTFAGYIAHFRGSPYDFILEPAKHTAKIYMSTSVFLSWFPLGFYLFMIINKYSKKMLLVIVL